jgi:hypothetical protein
MRPSSRNHRFPFSRAVAALGVALMVLLSVLAVRPDLHEALCHHDEETAAEHNAAGKTDAAGCVVTYFALGHVLALVLLLLRIGLVRGTEFLVWECRLAPVSPDFQLPPGCGPPLV